MKDSRKRYLIAYDIPDDKVRSRVADLLEAAGLRVQRSVFECSLDTQGLDSLAHRLARLIDALDNADIRVYRLCRSCFADSFGLGDLERGAGSQPWIVA